MDKFSAIANYLAKYDILTGIKEHLSVGNDHVWLLLQSIHAISTRGRHCVTLLSCREWQWKYKSKGGITIVIILNYLFAFISLK